MKEYTLEELKSKGVPFYRERDQERVNEAVKQVEQVSEFYPCYPVFKCEETKDRFLVETARIYLKHPSLRIAIKFDSYRKKWNLVCESLWHMNNVSTYDKSPEAHGLKEPNQIGVLSVKKILQWVNYYEALFAGIAAIDMKNIDKKQAFIDSLKGQPVVWGKDNKSGYIVKNGIEYIFRIEETSISENIAIHYDVDAGFSTFLRLSDNKYLPSKIK